ncbi:MAG: MerR family transcriptional regulator [Pseudomonadales bacterium]
MKIGDVAEQLGIPASTIRYYETEGLLNPQLRVSGRRELDADALLTLRFIKLAQTAGFTIEEMKILLGSYNQNPDPKSMWQELLESKRKAVQLKIAELRRMDRVLGALRDCTCSSLQECVQVATARKK